MRKYRTHKEILTEFMKDPEFKKGYESLRPKYEAISTVIKERIKNNMTQKELAEKIKTKQSNISRFESGRIAPSLSFLNKIAQAFNKRLEIRFRPAV